MPLGKGTLVGAYQVDRLIGRGGMGEVYLATHRVLDRPVALKLLAPQLGEDPGFRDRFLAESRLAASLDHPNVVTVYEAGESGGQLYLAMRFVEGDDLEALVKRHGRLEPDRALGLLRGVADALDAAHARGLVHRDVKPGNILVANPGTATEHPYLADFGLVKRLDAAVNLTRTGQFLGSAGHVAPEQIEGDPVDRRADVYSLAAVAFHLLAGQPPFERVSEMATLWAHVNAPVPLLSEVRPELAAADQPLARGMAKARDDRQPSAGRLIEELGAALRAGAAVADAGPTAASGAPAVAAVMERRPRVRARTRGVGLVGAAAAVGVVVLGGLLLANRPGTGLSPTATLGASSPRDTSVGTAAVSPLASERWQEARLGLLEAGDYIVTAFDPDLLLTLGEGWIFESVFPHTLHFTNVDHLGSNLYISKFLYPVDPADPRGIGRILDVQGTVAIAVWLDEHPSLSTSAGPYSPGYNGINGYTVDFIPDIPQSRDQGGCEVPCIALFFMADASGPADRLAVVDGRYYRMSLLEVGPEVVAVITEAPSEGEFVTFGARVVQISRTLRFVDPE